MSRNRMTENEKVYFFCLLFPPLWIFLPALILCDIGESVKAKWQRRRSSGIREGKS